MWFAQFDMRICGGAELLICSPSVNPQAFRSCFGEFDWSKVFIKE
jgi:hypothetical protein